MSTLTRGIDRTPLRPAPHNPMIDIIEHGQLIQAWLDRDREPRLYWPGEPDNEPESPTAVCDCGAHVPYKDMYTIPHPYREIWGCLDCLMQSRAAAS